MNQVSVPDVFLGPMAALAISIVVGWQFITMFIKTTEKLIDSHKQEVVECNERYKMVFNELMKLKDKEVR